MPTGVLGIRDINSNMWPSGAERGGVFVNLARTAAPTVRPNADALENGDIYFNTTSDTLFIRAAGAWTSVGAVGAITLGTAYTNGQTITRDSATLLINDDRTNATDTFSISKQAVGSGDLVQLAYTAAATGNALNITMTTAGTTTRAILVDGQAAVRATNPLIDVNELGTGAVPTVSISGDAVTTGPLLQVAATAAVAPVANTNGMITLDMTTAAVATQGMLVIGPAAGRTGAALRMTDAGTSTGSLISLAQSSTSSANVIAYTTSGAVTGDVVNINLANAGVAAQALVINSQTAIRTGAAGLISVVENGTGAVATMRIDGAGVTTGPLLALTATAAIAPVAGTDGMMTIDMTTAATTAEGLLIIGPAAARTGAALIITDAGTSSGQLIELSQSGTSSANVISYATSALVTGDVINIDLTNAGTAAQALVIAGQAGAATSELCLITANGTGAGHSALRVVAGGAVAGNLVELAATAASTGDMLSIDNTSTGAGADMVVLAATLVGRTGDCLRVDDAQTTGTGSTVQLVKSGLAAAGPVLDIDVSGTPSTNCIDIDYTGVATAPAIAFDTTVAFDNDVIALTLTNCGTAAQALVIVGQAGAATSELVSITANGTGAGHSALNLVAGGVVAGDLLSCTATAAMTGDMVSIVNTSTDAAADMLVLNATLVGRTGDCIRIDDAATTGTGSSLQIVKSGALGAGPVVDLDISGTISTNAIDIDYTGVATAPVIAFNTTVAFANDVININMANMGAAGRALDITSSATAHTGGLIEITETAASAGNCITYDTGAVAVTGDFLDWSPDATAIGTRALDLNGLGARTVNVIDIDCTGADVAAAIAVDVQGVGASGVPAGLSVSGTVGDLLAGADLARFLYTGSPSSTSNVVAIEQTTGAGVSGSYALYVSATGTNVEGLYVDDGNVLIDEQLARYRLRTTAPADGAVAVAATDSGSVFTNRNFTIARTYTLPAVAAGLHFWFVGIVNVGYTVTGAAVDLMTTLNSATADSVAFTTSGQIIGSWLYVISDGTNWYSISTSAGVGGTYTITVAA